jgi:hypothetical protein
MKSIDIPLPQKKWEPIKKSSRRSEIVYESSESESSDSDSDTAINKQQNDQQQSVTNHVFFFKLKNIQLK